MALSQVQMAESDKASTFVEEEIAGNVEVIEHLVVDRRLSNMVDVVGPDVVLSGEVAW